MAGEEGRPGTLYEPKFCFGAPRVPLYALADWHNGLAFKNIDFSPDGLPVIKIGEIKSGVGTDTARTSGCYSDDVRLRDGDLLFCWSGQPETSIGTYRWFGGEAWLNQHIFRVIPKPGVTAAYLFALLRYLQPNFVQIAANKQTTGLGHVTKADLRELKVEVPSTREQHRIAEAIASLDDKIELNRRMAATMETMARALFKSWFVDFDPVHAKADGRPTGLSPEIAALFPENFADGGLPRGWRSVSLYEFARVIYGAPFASSRFNNDGSGMPLIRIRDLATHDPGVFTEEVHRNAHTIEPGDIVVGMDGEFRCHLWRGPSAYLNQRLCHLEPIAETPKSFVFFALELPLSRFEAGAVGTTVIHLGKKDLDTVSFVSAGPQVIRAFGAIADVMIGRSVACSLQSRALASLRDTLLPKLISGELRIADAERTVAAA